MVVDTPKPSDALWRRPLIRRTPEHSRTATNKVSKTGSKRNKKTEPTDIESVFAGTIHKWRQALSRLAARGKISTFDNDYCSQRGLEPDAEATKETRDISYIFPVTLG